MKKIFVIVLILLLCTNAGAQPKNQGKAALLHIPMKAEQLPYPGAPITLSVTLENTKNSQLSVKGFFVRDGRLIEQNLEGFSTDNLDRVVYSTTLNAPLAELNYQFVLMDGQTPLANSGRFTVRRNCIPNVAAISAKIPEGTPMKDRLKLLQIQATSIQNEVTNYETTFKLLDELKLLTEK